MFAQPTHRGRKRDYFKMTFCLEIYFCSQFSTQERTTYTLMVHVVRGI